jgi:signal transduction histidine kinase
LVAGALLLTATFTFYLQWLAAPRPHHGWMACAMIVLGSQVLVSSGLRLLGPSRSITELRWVSAVDLVAVGVTLALVILSLRGAKAFEPLLLGLALGLELTALHAAAFLAPAPADLPTNLGLLVLTMILVGYGAIATAVWQDPDLPRWARQRLAVTISLIGVAHIARYGVMESRTADVIAAAALVCAAALWTSSTFAMLRETLADQRQRSAGLEESLLQVESSWRGSREHLHELRSTVAGAASASRLLGRQDIDTDTRTRLERGIRAELGRLERLVTEQPPGDPGPVDLDATLDVLLTSHRARGRAISWEPTGAAVHARPDDVAEALNILLDNAATHGGPTSSVAVTHRDDTVEISVTDEGPGVPAEERDRIFDWGVHGTDSPGQGIGLNLARRLMSSHGGSLTLADASTPGSSFVIRLPSARRSPEASEVDDVRRPA